MISNINSLPNVQSNTNTRKIAHPIDIFSLAVTDKQILSASGASSIQVHSTTDADFPLAQTIEGAHKVGCHHIVVDGRGSRAVSVGFAGEVQIWSCSEGTWSKDNAARGNKPPVTPVSVFFSQSPRN